MAVRHAVVTGGAGFVGSHLCEQLLDRGWHVVCLDNLSTGSRANVDHLHRRFGFQFDYCDVTEPFDVAGPVDLVLHFASPASPPDYLRLPVETLKAGSYGTLNTLDLAQRKGARYILASTSEVYGDPLIHPQPESYRGNVSPVGPRSVYDEAKRFAEAATTAYRTAGTNTGIVRIFNTYGPRMRPDDGRAIPTFIGQALTGQPLTVAGTGVQTRSICYVTDTVAGILAMADTDAPGPINIGSEAEFTVLALAKLILTLTGSESKIMHVPLPEDDPRVRRPDTTLAKLLLRWEPLVWPEDGLRTVIAWTRDQ